jgi:hypothetical protein
VSCKACASECPSNGCGCFKIEFLYHQKANGFRCEIKFLLITLNKLGSIFPALTNFMVNQPLDGRSFKREAISKWIETNKSKRNYFICKRKVVLFCDEFTNYYDVSVGIDALNY